MDGHKTIAVLGSTGSIGRQTLDVVAQHPEKFTVMALAVHSSIDLLCEQIDRFHPQVVAVWEPDQAAVVRERTAGRVRVLEGMDGLKEIAGLGSVDVVVNALVGMVGLEPTLAALKAGKSVALANKETLVAGGELVMATARESQASLIPVDSEHSAIFQCLQGSPQGLDSVIITASGGPFWRHSREQIELVTVEQALLHPRWKMGPKITIDSATMMNKGLEVIEARWLFGLQPQQIRVMVHPQSIVHSLVEFVDGSLLAQLGPTDMRIAIQYALTYPDRLPSPAARLSLAQVGRLEFAEPDHERFPALSMAYRAMEMGGTASTVLNAANEVAVAAFLQGKISFTAITKVVETVVARHSAAPASTLAAVLDADLWGRRMAEETIREL